MAKDNIIRETITDFSGGMTPYTRVKTSKPLWRALWNVEGRPDKADPKYDMSRLPEYGGGAGQTDVLGFTTYKSGSDSTKMYAVTSDLKMAVYTGLESGETLTVSNKYSLNHADLGIIDEDTPLVQYKNKLFFYGRETTGDPTAPRLFYWDPSNPTSDCVETTAVGRKSVYGTMPQLATHNLDDIMYYSYNNYIGKVDGTTITNNVLELPSSENITSLTEHGGYIAIATINTRDKATVYLWDRNASEVTTDSKTDLGDGMVKHLVSIGGQLMAIMDSSLSNRNGKSKLSIFKIHGSTQYLPPSLGQVVNEYEFNDITISEKPSQVVRNKMYFLGSFDGMAGVYSIGGDGILNLEHTIPNTANGYEPSSTMIDAFYIRGFDYYIQGSDYAYYSDQGGDNVLSKGAAPEILNGGEPHVRKRLKRIIFSFEKLKNKQYVNFWIREYGETVWTLISARHVDADERYVEVLRNEEDDVNLPEFNELEVVVGWKLDENDWASGENNLTATELHMEYEPVNNLAG